MTKEERLEEAIRRVNRCTRIQLVLSLTMFISFLCAIVTHMGLVKETLAAMVNDQIGKWILVIMICFVPATIYCLCRLTAEEIKDIAAERDLDSQEGEWQMVFEEFEDE